MQFRGARPWTSAIPAGILCCARLVAPPNDSLPRQRTLPMRITSVSSIALAALAAACSVRSEPQVRQQGASQPYDVVIVNGKLVDGTGNPWFYGDVAINGDHIAHIGPLGSLGEAVAKQKIDARGLVVAPGVI